MLVSDGRFGIFLPSKRYYKAMYDPGRRSTSWLYLEGDRFRCHDGQIKMSAASFEMEPPQHGFEEPVLRAERLVTLWVVDLRRSNSPAVL